MQSQKLRQEYAISIRRKQISQKMQAMRSMLHSQQQINYSLYLPTLQHALHNTKPLPECLAHLKILSFDAENAQKIFHSQLHHKLYNYLEVNSATLSTQEYNDILTILINLCVHVQLDITNSVMQLVAAGILKSDREMISLWMIANIVYQKSAFSAVIAGELVAKCDAVEFMQGRIKKKFDTEGDIVVFCFFCCSFLTVSAVLAPKNIKAIFEVVMQVLKIESKAEENFWFLSEALVDHGSQIAASEYEIFGTEIMAKFENYCKKKKTKFVKNYLKMLIAFTSHDINAYDKMLKYEVFKSLDFCLENRFPQVKKLCAEIAWNLLVFVGEKVDIENVSFFSQLVLQILNLEKQPLDVQIAIVKYSNKFFQISVLSKITKQAKQKFIEELLSGTTIDILSTVMINSNGNIELLSETIQLLTIFIRIDESQKIVEKCRAARVPEFLAQIQTQNQNFYAQINNFLNTFT